MQPFNIDSKDTAFQTASLNIGIIDEDDSTSSKALREYLGSLHTLTDLPFEKEILLDQLFYRNLDYILILPKDFEEQLLTKDSKTLFETVQIPEFTAALL